MKTLNTYLILIVLIACNSKPAGIEHTEQPKPETSSKKLDIGSNINIENFKFQADSIITEILGIQTSFEIEHNEYSKGDLSIAKGVWTIAEYISLNCDTIDHYRLRLYTPNTSLSLNIFEARFEAEMMTDTVFSYLKYLANEDDIDAQPEQYSPGLTYENDYVYKQSNRLIWLNTKCLYSFSNHLKYANALRSSLMDSDILDSIVCRCGAVNCK